MGFYEGGLCYPDPLTWLDRLVVQLSDALVIYSSDVKGLKEISSTKPSAAVSVLEKLVKTEESVLAEGKTKESTSDSETTNDSTSSIEEYGELISTKKVTRPTYLCRRRTVSGPQATRVGGCNGKIAMN